MVVCSEVLEGADVAGAREEDRVERRFCSITASTVGRSASENCEGAGTVCAGYSVSMLEEELTAL